MSEISNKISGIVVGFGFGSITGIATAILAFLALNIWYLFVGEFVLLATIAVWGIYAITSTSYYKLLRKTFPKEFAFFVGLLATISLMSYSYNVLAYDILPYNSLQTHQIAALVIIGTCMGLAKIIVGSKKEEAKETSQ